MECEKAIMSFTPSKELTPVSSLGGGDTSFQTFVGVKTQKLFFSNSPVQIFRQRYWLKSPQKKPISIIKHYEAKEVFIGNEAKKAIHISLEDLSDNRAYIKDGHHVAKYSNYDLIEKNTLPKRIDKEKVQAAHRIYEVLLLNAWRKRKEVGEELSKMIHNLASELHRYKIKLHVLKSLFKKETERNSYAMKEIAAYKSTCREYENIIEGMKKEKERIVLEYEEIVSHERILRTNMKNDLIQSNIELGALEEQLAKETEKVNRLRGEKDRALNKVDELKERLEAKSRWIESLAEGRDQERAERAEAEGRWAAEVQGERSRNGELQEENKRLMRVVNELQEAKRTLEEEVALSMEESYASEGHVSALEKELKMMEKNHEIQLKNATMFLSDILNERRQLEELTEEKKNDFIILAKTILNGVRRLPLAILHSITYAFWPFDAKSVQRNPLLH